MKIFEAKFLRGKHSRVAILLLLTLLFFSVIGLNRLFEEHGGGADTGYESKSLELRVGLSQLRTSLYRLENKYVSELGTRGYVSVTLLSLDEDFVLEMERIGGGRIPFVLALSSEIMRTPFSSP